MPQTKKPLEGMVAVVAGATRGAGRGIARGLGEAGATVYCTGRSVRGSPSPYQRPETIEETADIINAAGGAAIAVRVDHTVEADVQEFFKRVQRDHGRLDVLADSVAGEDPLLGNWTTLDKLDLSRGLDAMRQSLFSHVITAKYAIHLMNKRRGLIVEVCEGDFFIGNGGNVVADLIKSSVKNLAVRLSWELRGRQIAVIGLTPGFLRSESMLEHFKVTEANWRDAGEKDRNFLKSESPLFVGRAVAALAADPNVMEKSGYLTSSSELSREYGFTDVDGSRPDFLGNVEDVTFPPWFLDYGNWYNRIVDRVMERHERNWELIKKVAE